MLAARSQPPLTLSISRLAASAWVAALGWVAIVVAGHLVGQALVDRDPLVHVGAPPLVGSFDLRIGPGLLPALALAAAALAWAPTAAGSLRWGRLLAAAWAGAAGWAVALGASGGLGALAAPLRTRYEYLAAVPLVDDLSRFIDAADFVSVLPSLPTHVKAHPPGLVTILTALDRIGLGGAEAAAALVIAAGALAAPAALVALRSTAGDGAARRAAPYLVFTPAAVWVATSADALFAGVAATGIACFALASEHGRRRSRMLLGLLAGVVLGAALMLSYSVAPLGLLVLAIAVVKRAWLALGIAAAGCLAVLGAFAGLGFFWLDGLRATEVQYSMGISARRPYADFIAINLAAFALAVGPAAGAGLGRLRERGAWLLAAPAIAALAACMLSGLSKGEVERIWLPYVPWILVATAGLGLRAGRGWLAAQLALALALQAGVRSPW